MDPKKTQPELPAAKPAPPQRPAYEPPRVLARRRVEHATLFSGDGGPGGGIGGE
ncbi:MAG: hypothetical protein QM704_03915 [Anaeromyxobacteraceae bacterium]